MEPGTGRSAVGPWQTTDVTDDFTVKLHARAGHGADYFLVYVANQGLRPPPPAPAGRGASGGGRWGPDQTLTPKSAAMPASPEA